MTVLIVDDHAGFRAVARAVLEADGFEVVGEAADGSAAIDQVFRLDPDIVLLDVQLPDLDGFEVAERIGEGHVAVVLVSSRESTSYRRRLAGSPARGFISKADLTGQALAALIG